MTTRRGIRAVTFDCWGTLIHERDMGVAHRERVSAVERVVLELGGEVSAESAAGALEDAWHRHWQLWSSGTASGAREIAAWALERFEILDAEVVDGLSRQLAEAALSSEIVVLDDAHRTLEMLAGFGVRRALVCDTGLTPGRVMRELLADVGLLDWLEVVVFSDEVGEPKPNRAPFQAALEGLGVEAPDAMHVGDLRRTDVEGAREMGMGTIRIRHHHDDESDHEEADHVVDTHADLGRLLAELLG